MNTAISQEAYYENLDLDAEAIFIESVALANEIASVEQWMMLPQAIQFIMVEDFHRRILH